MQARLAALFSFLSKGVCVKNLQEATERICDLKGSHVALDALVPAVIESLPLSARAVLLASFDAHAEVARTAMLHADISDRVLAAFERDVARNRAILQREAAAGAAAVPASVDALLLTTAHLRTFAAGRALSSASGFFYRRGDQLFLVSNRHVFADANSGHFPDCIEIGIHTDVQDLACQTLLSLPIRDNGRALWREAADSGGPVDIAAIAIPSGCLPVNAVLHAFDATHLEARGEMPAVGDALTIVGFPLGFHDTVHHLAVARGASIASAYGIRFQRQGCFLTDARTHRGSSGSPVVRRRTVNPSAAAAGAWQLIGVHSTRMDMRGRDDAQDESLGLNCAWYADLLPALTSAV